MSDTPCCVRDIRCPRRDSGRVLSHLQELSLDSAGSRRALAQTGACGQLGSRTANRMAVPQSPSIRERACPARSGPARIRQHAVRRNGLDYSAGSTGPKTTTTSPWWTATASCWPTSGSATTQPALAQLLELLAEHGDSPGQPGPGRDRDPARPAGRLPARHRPHRSTRSTRWQWPATANGTPSPAGNPTTAIPTVLANVLRTDRHAHRPLPADSELAQAIAVLARAQQDAVWDRTTAHNKLRSHLREYFPGFLAAFAGARDGIMRPEARVILAAAPDPASAAQADHSPAPRAAEQAGRAAASTPRPQRLRDVIPHRADAPAPARRAGHGPADARPAAPARRRLRQRQTSSSRPPPSLLTSTQTPGSSPASQASARSPAPGCSPRSETTGPASSDAKGLKAYAAPRPSPAPAARQIRHPPQGQEQPARRRRIHLGILRADRITRRPCPLRPPPRRRRPAHRRPAQPVQPPARLPPPLPGHRPALRRDHRIPQPARHPSSSLTQKIRQLLDN